MSERNIAPYGSWASPITSDLIVSDTIRLIELAIDGDDVYPMWMFGMSSYGFQSSTSLICTYTENGSQHLARLNTRTLELEPLATPYCSFENLRLGPTSAVFVAGSPTKPSVLARFDLNTKDIEQIRHSSTVEIEEGYLSVPQALSFPTENGLTAHAYYYGPKNCDIEAPTNELPPLLVKSHGGPTSAASSDFNLTIQYWTSRGFAVLDVNYGGSTGYGRAYRDRLRGQWGVMDVDDCVNGALYLVEQKLADKNRLAIDGILRAMSIGGTRRGFGKSVPSCGRFFGQPVAGGRPAAAGSHEDQTAAATRSLRE